MTEINYWALPGLQKTIFDVKMDLVHTNVQRIIDICCRTWGVTEGQLKSEVRDRKLVEPRQVAQYLISMHTKNIGVERIGKMFNRNHATVLHSIRVVKNLMETNKDFKAKVEYANSQV